MDSINKQFGDIYDQYIDKIYRFIYIKVNNQETAQDIASKVFLKAFEAYKKPNAKIDNVGAFLYRIASNAVIDFYRERGRTNVVSSEVIAEVADNREDIYEKAIFGADVTAVKIAILKLNQDQQDLIIWHYLDDISIGEIAEIQGKPAGTIRVALHRALKSLRDIM